ncbi:MAG TPA: hypothetical protein VF169_24385 [Albitalea sp.]|uniref:hypothetical protein n=1 Tax=Piscinibacter sp. TaxID=1903157 RepID=UPI002ED65ADC
MPRRRRSTAGGEAKLPHERDETPSGVSNSTASNEHDRDRLRRGQQDVEAGRQATDRGPEADQAYDRLRKK